MRSRQPIPLRPVLEARFQSLFAPLVTADAAAFLRIFVKVQDNFPVAYFLQSQFDPASAGFGRLALPKMKDAIVLAAQSKGLPPLACGEVHLTFVDWKLKKLFVLVK